MSWHDDIGEDIMIDQIIERDSNYMEQTQEKPAPIFVEGISIREPSPKAPDFILLQQSFKAHDFFKWCQDHQDEKGWVNITLKRSKKGSIYGELDTWKPAKTEESIKEADIYNDTKYRSPQDIQNQKEAAQIFNEPLTDEELVSMSDIPF